MRPIAEHEPMERERFEREIVAKGEPAVIRGLVTGWPIVRAAKKGEVAEALRGAATKEPFEAWFGAPEIEGQFGYTDDFAGFNHERRLATVDQLLELLLRQRGSEQPYSMYAGGIPIRKHLPDLLPGIAVPMLDMERATLISLWLGNRTRTAAHWDLPQNLACVVAGRRRFTLFPTEQVANLYVGPLDFTLAGQPISLVDVDNPDLGRHPKFARAMEAAMTAELGPGDALYIPSLWWHAVASLDDLAAMINFWWRDAEPPLLTPLNALYHSVITMKNLGPKELAAWRVLFDHYIFGANGDPVAHLPEAGKGILGRRTPELVARVKKLLIDVLSR
ncbi:cupin-like domain-containing protein [Sphingomonas limnosediminicola]|uniref:Cupin-like domain-containing protein n=1 Tax=Sphingomonas limnosediminicola TaxID=940133 RepID=A0ABP7LHP6_9SPHN